MKGMYCITGVAGFIGSALAQSLLSKYKDIKIIGIDNINPYYSKKIKYHRIETLSKYKNFIFYKTSIDQISTIQSIIKKYPFDILIHLAAEVGVRKNQFIPSEYYKTNVYGTSIFLEQLFRNKNLSHAIIASSSSVYGKKKPPFKESMMLTSEDPLSSYGFSKLCTESVAKNFYMLTGIPTTIIRPFSVYGPNGRPDMFPIKALIASITKTPIPLYGDGKSKRDWTYISDMTDAIIAITKKPIALSTLLSLLQKEAALHKETISIKHEKKNNFETSVTWADNNLLEKIYHSSPKISLEEGIKNTAVFFFGHKNLYI